MTFWAVLAGVLGANLLTISFVWGAYSYSKHERAGTAGNKESNWAAVAVVAPLVVLSVAVGVALNTGPNWLSVKLGEGVSIKRID